MASISRAPVTVRFGARTPSGGACSVRVDASGLAVQPTFVQAITSKV